MIKSELDIYSVLYKYVSLSIYKFLIFLLVLASKLF